MLKLGIGEYQPQEGMSAGLAQCESIAIALWNLSADDNRYATVDRETIFSLSQLLWERLEFLRETTLPKLAQKIEGEGS